MKWPAVRRCPEERSSTSARRVHLRLARSRRKRPRVSPTESSARASTARRSGSAIT